MSTAQMIRPAPVAPIRRAPAARSIHGTQRDTFIDVLRVGAILVVVLLHWLMPVLSYEDGTLATDNVLAAPGAWIVTWVLQVMPLVFFAGGAATAMSIVRRSGPATPGASWVAARLVRIAWPVVPLAVVWIPLPIVLEAAGVPTQPLDVAARIVGQLLWFLAVYVVTIALTPLLVRAHRAFGGWEIAALAAAALAVDVTRFGLVHGSAIPGYLNIIIVWTAIYQVGVAYGHGRLNRLSGPRALVISGIGFATTAVLVAAGPYAPSMIGMPGAPLSNMNPPTAVLISLAVGQLGLAAAARPAIERWANRPEPAQLIKVLSARSMTIYLWHMPALVAVAGVAVVGFGFSTPSALSNEWWDTMPIWLAAATGVLVSIVALMGRFERPPHVLRPGAVDPTRVEAGAGLLGLALLALTAFGFRHTWFADGPPITLLACAALGGGLTLLRGRREASPRWA